MSWFGVFSWFGPLWWFDPLRWFVPLRWFGPLRWSMAQVVGGQFERSVVVVVVCVGRSAGCYQYVRTLAMRV